MNVRAVRLALVVGGLALVSMACGGGDDGAAVDTATAPVPVGEPGLRTARTGGMGTAFDTTPRSFSLTARNINHYERQVFGKGKAVFETAWVGDGADDFTGLGPRFDAAACSSCHFDDGRAAGPGGDGVLPVGFTVPLRTDDPATIDRYGMALSSASSSGRPEATVTVSYEEHEGRFADGTVYSLRAPSYTVDLGDGPTLPVDAVFSPRLAPQLPGMGLLELIEESDILAAADPDDADGDGISGRAGTAVDLLSGEEVLGRFGWNATAPTVEQQTATALFSDMGLTSRYFPTPECEHVGGCEREGSPLSTDYNPEYYADPAYALESLPGVEVSDDRLLDLTIYSQTLAVPGARDVGDPLVEQGAELFTSLGCTSCHAGPYTTRGGPMQGLSHQVIQPYTDLLLHDMGDGLADRTVAGDLVTTEWRTPPLWGLGLIDTVSGHTTLLHDGRARNVDEAILWHGGEAAASASAYRSLPADQRDALLAFLASL